jgi:hypothetical protein
MRGLLPASAPVPPCPVIDSGLESTLVHILIYYCVLQHFNLLGLVLSPHLGPVSNADPIKVAALRCRVLLALPDLRSE